MFKFKRVTAVALSAIMTFSMIGCGKDEESDSKKKKSGVDSKSIETISDAYDALASYKNGSFELESKISADIDGEKGAMNISANGKTDGENSSLDNYTMNIDFGGQNIEIGFDDLCTYADGRAYINLDSIIKTISDVDTEFGSYGLLMPEFNNLEDYKGKIMDFSGGLFDALLEGAEVEGEKGEFTATIKDAKEYKKSAEAILKYVEDSKSEVEDIAKDTTKLIDLKDYANKLIDDVDDDVVSAAEVFGLEGQVNKDTMDQVKESLADALDEYDPEELVGEIDFDELFESLADARKEFEEISDEDFAKGFEELDKAEIVLNIKVDSDAYVLSLDAEISGSGNTVELEATFKFNVEDVKVKAPSKTSTLTDIANYAKDNQDVLQEVVAGVQKWAEQFKDFGGAVVEEAEDFGFDTDSFEDFTDPIVEDPEATEPERTVEDPTGTVTDPVITEDPSAIVEDPSASTSNLQDTGDIQIVTSSKKTMNLKYDTSKFNLDPSFSTEGSYVFSTADDPYGTVYFSVYDESFYTMEAVESQGTRSKIAGYDCVSKKGDGYNLYYVASPNFEGLVIISCYLNESKVTDEDIVNNFVGGLK